MLKKQKSSDEREGVEGWGHSAQGGVGVEVFLSRHSRCLGHVTGGEACQGHLHGGALAGASFGR